MNIERTKKRKEAKTHLLSRVPLERTLEVNQVLHGRRVDMRRRAHVENDGTKERLLLFRRRDTVGSVGAVLLAPPGGLSRSVPRTIAFRRVLEVLAGACCLLRIVEDDVGVKGGIGIEEGLLETAGRTTGSQCCREEGVKRKNAPEHDDSRRRRFNLDERVRYARRKKREVNVSSRELESGTRRSSTVRRGRVLHVRTKTNATEESSSRTSNADQEECERGGDGSVDTCFDGCEDRHDDGGEEDDEFEGRGAPEPVGHFGRGDEVEDGVDDDG